MKIDRMTKGTWSKIRAFFDLQTSEGFTFKGFKLIEGINGKFVAFPSQKGNDDEYHDTVWADKDLKDKVNELAHREYGNPNPSNMEKDNKKTEELPMPVGEDDIPF